MLLLMKKRAALLSITALLLGIAACSDDKTDTDNNNDNDNSSDAGTSSSSGGEISSSSSSSGATGDAATTSSSSGGSSGSTSEFACKDVTPTGSPITPTPSDAPAPTPAGGTIAAGTYQLTSVVVYGGDRRVGALSLQVTLKVSDTQFLRSFSIRAGQQGGVGSDSGTYTTSGTRIVAEETCEDGQEDNGLGGFVGPYTATDTTLKIYQPAPTDLGGSNVTIELTATKQ